MSDGSGLTGALLHLLHPGHIEVTAAEEGHLDPKVAKERGLHEYHKICVAMEYMLRKGDIRHARSSLQYAKGYISQIETLLKLVGASLPGEDAPTSAFAWYFIDRGDEAALSFAREYMKTEPPSVAPVKPPKPEEIRKSLLSSPYDFIMGAAGSIRKVAKAEYKGKQYTALATMVSVVEGKPT